MKNLNAIVWLYRGEVDKYKKLLNEYRRYLVHFAAKLKANNVCRIITPTVTFEEVLSAFENFEMEQKELSKFDLEHIVRKDKKVKQKYWEDYLASIKEAIIVAKEAIWLTEKFGEGEYKDILGLCKCASRAEIAEKGYSLTPGAYVGVAEVEGDGVDFTARMVEIHNELLTLQSKSNELMETISKNIKEMGL